MRVRERSGVRCAGIRVRWRGVRSVQQEITSSRPPRTETLKVWDAYTGACLSTLCVDSRLVACPFHPDGEHIVAAGAGGVYFLRWVR